MNSQEELDRVKAERDALVAHVERLIGAGCDMQDDYQMGDDSPHHAGIDAWAEALKDTPTTSLARLKAQWRAEVLERYAEGIARDNEPTDMVCVEDVHTLLLHEAAELRQQAEEG